MWSIHRLPSFILIGTALGLLLLIGTSVEAHSQERSVPLSYISLVEYPRIRTPSQRIHHNSEFDITFSLHRGEEEVRLSLEPNHDAVPQGMNVEYLDTDGKVSRKERIQRHEVRVFKGLSWVRDESGQGWTHAGWARIMVQRDGVDPLFTGVFMVNSDTHHIQLKSRYLKTKKDTDPDLDPSGDDFMVVWRDSDVKKAQMGKQAVLNVRDGEEESICHAISPPYGGFNNQFHQPNLFDTTPRRRDPFFDVFSKFSDIHKRDSVDSTTTGNSGGLNLKNNIGSTYGCPSTKQMALVGVAVDCTYLSDFADDQEARIHIISQFNSASAVFESTFNISLGIKSFVLSPTGEDCPGTAPSTAPWNLPCTNSATISDRLSIFSNWRGQSDRLGDGNAFWTLLSKCQTAPSVGLAWVGMLCQDGTVQNKDGQYVSGTNIVASTSMEWRVIAHEIGHTMGAVHDCTDTQCASNLDDTSQCCPLSVNTCDAAARYLMNPSTSDSVDKFSPCTIGNICGAFSTRGVSRQCLTDNRDVEIITGNRCGNGIVETGEECDCGGADGCANNSCCDAATCKFKNNAVCDDSNDDCCTGCQFASSSQICRPSTGECDPEERCTGSSSFCPKDTVESDGASCSNGLTCISGQCTSRDQQCRTIMGVETGNNHTSSCNSQSCQIQCASPDLGPGFCYEMQQNFLDGTPCEGDGRCKSGTCRGSTTLGAIKQWIDEHRNLVIGVSVGVGSLIVISLIICICRCCSRRRKKLPPPPPMRYHNTAPPFSPQRQQSYNTQQGEYQNRGTWEEQQQPLYNHQQQQQQQQQQYNPYSQSTRYG